MVEMIHIRGFSQPTIAVAAFHDHAHNESLGFFSSEGGGTRTHGQRIKSPLLYRLSYALNLAADL